MKKTMFITSVIMVVVMAIALTTSSLAWFSAAGRAQVTTTPLTVQAASSTSTGILISLDNDAFAENVTLAAAPNGGMKPIVPIDGSLQSGAPVQANLLKALYGTSFIGNKVASGLVVDPAIQENETGYNVAAQRTIFAKSSGISGDNVAATFDGYYTDEVYIANMASGGEAGVKIIPSIAFQRKIGDAAYTAYDGSNHTSTSPILYVAILADTVDGDVEYAVGGSANNPESWSDYATDGSYYDTQNTPLDSTDDVQVTRLKDTWELVQIFSTASTHQNASQQYDQIASSLAMGNYAENFASGRVVNRATNIVSLDLEGKTSTALAPVTEVQAMEGRNYGTAKHFKIVAWYDGASLTNNNSGWNFNFALTFTAE